MDAAVMEKLNELIDALSPTQDVSMMEEDEKNMYEAMHDEDKMAYSKMEDDEKKKYRGMDDDKRMEYMKMYKMRKMEPEGAVDKMEDATTASDSAEERLKDLDEIQEDNIDEVAKSIAKAVKDGKGNAQVTLNLIQKGMNRQRELARNANIDKGMGQLTQALAMIAENQAIQGKALENFLEGQGIKDEVMKSVQADKKTEPQSQGDATSVGREIAKALREEMGGTAGQEKKVEKSISDDPKGFMQGFAQAFRDNPNIKG